MNYTKHDKNTDIVPVKEELSQEFEELEFEEKKFEDYKPEVSTCQNDQEASQIVIKEEIDCDIDDGSVSGFDSLHSADKVASTTLRRSSRRRCLRFSVVDLLKSSSDESSVSKHNKKLRTHTSCHCVCEKRLSTARGAQLPEGRSKCSDLSDACGKSFEYFCDICGRRFSRTSDLRRHAVTHSGSKPYTCGLCGKSFKRPDNLKGHWRLHSGEKYRCAQCGREFSQAGHLSEHARTHTGERPFRCADCGKAFRCRRDLRDHVRIHTGERPFACRVCGKAFRQAAHLRGHLRLHTGERRHGCDACGRLFFRRSHLELHACAAAPRHRRPRKLLA